MGIVLAITEHDVLVEFLATLDLILERLQLFLSNFKNPIQYLELDKGGSLLGVLVQGLSDEAEEARGVQGGNLLEHG